MSLTWKQETHQEIAFLQLQGDLGKPEAEQLKNHLNSLMSKGRCRIVLDMEEVRYVDSFAIVILLRANREAMGGGGEIKLLRPRHVVKRFMDMGKVLELFDRHESKIEILKSFQKLRNSGPVRPVNHLRQAGRMQKIVVLRLVEILIQKGLVTAGDYQEEINRSAHLVLQVFRKELES